ncbi:hypothetical protein ACAG26_07750 [Mycobacterium sp. pUA109]|uniref:hypothetical protein n=1 Tax=Mycobacterium sp. pUA109 TaxID=3238982 RepID=UPI00351B23AA
MTLPTDFSQPIELRCNRDADATMLRAPPLIIFQALFVWLVVAVVVGLMFPNTPAVWAGAATVISVASVVRVWARKRNELRRTYGQLQRLELTPNGLRRYDEAVVIDMPWSQLLRFEYRNSALPAGRLLAWNPMAGAYNTATRHSHTVMAWGIIGHGTVSPLPTASQRKLKIHDRLYGSQLQHGQPHNSDRCLIFPAEFEENWTGGVIGAWLCHYRPDLALPESV